MDNRVLDEAMKFVRHQVDKNQGDVPAWGKYQQMVQELIKDDFNLKFKMPQEYYYAYLRGKGLSHGDCLETMGIDTDEIPQKAVKKSFWKFW